MALAKKILRDKMLDKIANLTDSGQAHNVLASAINEHLLESGRIKGSYIGVMPDGKPDPNSGVKIWHITVANISGSMLANGSRGKANHSAAINGWLANLKLELMKKVQIKGLDETGMVSINTPVKIMEASPTVSMNQATSQKQAFDTLAQAIVDAIKSAVVTPTASGSSNAGGQGTITMETIQ